MAGLCPNNAQKTEEYAAHHHDTTDPASKACILQEPACESQTAVLKLEGIFGKPTSLLLDEERRSRIMARLDAGSQDEKHMILMWLKKALKQLALSEQQPHHTSTCRIVQKALREARGEDRGMLFAELLHGTDSELKAHVKELYESPQGNHVLSQAIDVSTYPQLIMIISALRGLGTTISKHRYGCRVMRRLLEHCGDREEHIGELLDEIVLEADTLSNNGNGTYVIQAMLEYAPGRRKDVVLKLLPRFAELASNRSGSLVVERLLSDDVGDMESRELAIQALLRSEVANIACTRYGSYVMKRVAALQENHGSVDGIARMLAIKLPDLLASQHAMARVVAAFGLLLPVPQCFDLEGLRSPLYFDARPGM